MKPYGASFLMAIACSTSAAMAAGQETRPLLAPPPMDGSVGQIVFASRCASCHVGDESDRAPGFVALSAMSPRSVLAALESGRMRRHGESLTAEQRMGVAEWLTGKPLTEMRFAAEAFCGSAPSGAGGVYWSGWGGGNGESGFRPDGGIAAADLPDLELAWAFAFPDADQVRSKPAVVGDRVLVGSAYGETYSIDLETGCVHWVFPADAAVRGAIAIGAGPGGAQTAFFVDFRTNVYAIDTASGELLWRSRAGTHPDHTNTGTPAVYGGRVFVPISSMEIASAQRPSYACCTSSGGVAAFDAETGGRLWSYRTIDEEPRRVGTNEAGAGVFAPSGAPVWASPTVDADRGLLYIGTGENYTRPTTGASDAIIALDMATGEVVWSFQATADDAWNLACGPGPNFENCPDAAGPDLDFGMAPILVTREDGSQLLVAGQKSGVVWGLDPDAGGEVVWARRIGRGGALGGVHWGLASDGRRVYAPISDHPGGLVADPRNGGIVTPNATDPPAPGLYALDLAGGEVVWEARADAKACAGRNGCMPFLSAAPTVIEGAVLAGSLDGHLRGYATEDGSLLVDLDTAGVVETVNGIPGRGGALDGPGPVVARGMLLVNSGYGMFGQMPGNLLLAYRVRR